MTADGPRASRLRLPAVTRATLDNGLRVVVHSRMRTPVVATSLWFRAGSRDELPGRTGRAHLLEHMMFKGSANFAKGAIDKATQLRGGDNNAVTWTDYTAYTFNLPLDGWEVALDIEADRMHNVLLDPAEFEAEKQVVLAELREGLDDPWTRLANVADESFYGSDHPYAHPIVGREPDVEAMTVADLRDFYDRWYQPANAVLVIVGAVEPQAAIDAAAERLGGLPSQPAPEPTAAPHAAVMSPEFEVVRSDVGVERFYLSWLAPDLQSDDAVAAKVLDTLLSQGESSRLWHALVEETARLTDVSSWYLARPLGGEISITGECAPGRSYEDAVGEIERVLAEVVAEPPGQRELQKVRNQLATAFSLSLDTAEHASMAIGDAELMLGSTDAADALMDKLMEVTAVDVQRVGADILASGKKRHLIVLAPEADDEIELPVEVRRERTRGFEVESATLDNGLEIRVVTQDDAPGFFARLDFGDLPLHQPPGHGGMLRLLGDMLDEGTERRSARELKETVDYLGISLYPASDGCSVRGLTRDADAAFSLMADVILRPTFPADALERRRAEHLADLVSSLDSPDTIARRMLVRQCYPARHPFGSLRTSASIRAVTREMLADFHRTHFAPNRAALMVVGSLTMAQVVEMTDRHLGEWAPAELPMLQLPELPRPDAAGQPDPDYQWFAMPERTACCVCLGHLGVRRADPDFVTLAVMDQILGTGAGFTDRISQDLRDTRGLAYSVHASISEYARLDVGLFRATINTNAEHVEPAIAAIREHIRRLQTEPPTDDEVAAAKAYLTGSFVFTYEGMRALVRLLTHMHVHKLGIDYLDRMPEKIAAVTAEDIRAAAERHLFPDRLHAAIAGPTGARD